MALWRVRATVVDKPGFLAVLTASLALRSVNILTVSVHVTEDGAVDDFLVDAPDSVTEEQLLAAVERGRGSNVWVAPAHARSLVDAPTRALDLATYLVREPAAVGNALAELLDATATWQPEPEQLGAAGARMWVPAPGGGAWLLERPGPDFTPAEYARAQALLSVAAATGAGTGAATLLLGTGAELTVRRATAGDLAAAREMHRRCSPESLHRRYLSGTTGPTDAALARLLRPARGITLLAVSGTEVVAMVSLVGEGDQAELAVLVEDAWHRHGLGTALLRRGLRLAADLGFGAVALYSHAQNVPLERTLRRLAIRWQTDRDGTLVTFTIPTAVSTRAA